MTIQLNHFVADEFREWWPQMSVRLLVTLDLFRWQWGDIVTPSPVEGGIGRSDDSESQHNVDQWGEVRAIDAFPRKMVTRDDCELAIEIADNLGFTGIGIYPETDPSPMIHLDVRVNRYPGDPAKWGALRNQSNGWDYVAMQKALETMDA